jgi:hypothetical protein
VPENEAFTGYPSWVFYGWSYGFLGIHQVRATPLSLVHEKDMCLSFPSSWSGPLSLLSCASWSSSSTVFCDGVLSRTIPWALLTKQFYENKAYQTFYEQLREAREVTQARSPSNVDPVKDMMRLMMDEFTSLHNYSRPVESNMSNAMFIACTNDGYVLHDGLPHMNEIWPGCHVRYIRHGHISAFLFNQSVFQNAVAELLQRQQPNIKLKRNPIVSLLSANTSTSP